jgi:hypothetical protein
MPISNGAYSELPLFPPDLFTGVVPQFDPVAVPVSSPPSNNPRQEIIERVFEEAEPEFIQMYCAFLLSYAKRVEDFIACEVTAEFNEAHRPVTKIEGKQLGGLYQSLQRVGAIEKTGSYRARNQGSASAVYRLKR